jgi:hypothetical protein
MVRKFVEGSRDQTSKHVVVCCKRHNIISRVIMPAMFIVVAVGVSPWTHDHLPTLLRLLVWVVLGFLLTQAMWLYMYVANRAHRKNSAFYQFAMTNIDRFL